jgi:hypothetical protein
MLPAVNSHMAAGDGASAERSAADQFGDRQESSQPGLHRQVLPGTRRNGLGTRPRPTHEAGIACTSHVEVGDVAQTIARYVRDLYCNQVIMGTRGLGSGAIGAISGLLMGSIATKCCILSRCGDIREVTSFGLLGGSLRMR